MEKIPSIYVRIPWSSKVDTDDVTPECRWIFDPKCKVIVTVKRDGTPMRWKGGQWFQRRVLKSKDFVLTDPWVASKNFEPCQPLPGYDAENKQWEWPGWVPLDAQYKELMDEALSYAIVLVDGQTYELCGPKINGNPEQLVRHTLFAHGKEIIGVSEYIMPLTTSILTMIVAETRAEGIVLYEEGGTRKAKLKRRELGLEWPMPRTLGFVEKLLS